MRPSLVRATLIAFAIGMVGGPAAHAQSPALAARSYLVLVASESVDLVTLLRFRAGALQVERRTSLRLDSSFVAAPVALRSASDDRFYYAITAHGLPSGELIKVSMANDSGPAFRQRIDSIKGREPLGGTPSALQITADGAFAWVTISPVDDEAKPSWIEVIYLGAMVEAARIETCVGGHGGQFTADGSAHYSLCAADDALLEIDARTMKPLRRLVLGSGGGNRCGSSSFAMSPDGAKIFVACSASGEIVEVDERLWTVTRRTAMGGKPGAIAVTRNGQTLVITHPEDQTVSTVDASTGHETGRFGTWLAASTAAQLLPEFPAWQFIAPLAVRASSRAPAAIALTDDDRYAFVSIVRAGAEPGSVLVLDLTTGKRVASVEVARGAGAIEFWKALPSR